MFIYIYSIYINTFAIHDSAIPCILYTGLHNHTYKKQSIAEDSRNVNMSSVLLLIQTYSFKLKYA